MKRCSKCGEERQLNDFPNDKSRRDGKHPYCKPCMRAKTAAWKAADPERTKRLDAEWRRKNIDKKRASDRNYYKANREKVKAAVARWHSENREKSRAAKQAWAKANPDKVRAAHARDYEKNRPRFTAHANKRRAGLQQRACLLTPEGEQKIKALYGFAAYLTEKFGKPYHVDHIVPLFGKTCSGLHHPDNLRVVLAQHNLSKSNKIDYDLVPHAFRWEEN